MTMNLVRITALGRETWAWHLLTVFQDKTKASYPTGKYPILKRRQIRHNYLHQMVVIKVRLAKQLLRTKTAVFSQMMITMLRRRTLVQEQVVVQHLLMALISKGNRYKYPSVGQLLAKLVLLAEIQVKKRFSLMAVLSM